MNLLCVDIRNEMINKNKADTVTIGDLENATKDVERSVQELTININNNIEKNVKETIDTAIRDQLMAVAQQPNDLDDKGNTPATSTKSSAASTKASASTTRKPKIDKDEQGIPWRRQFNMRIDIRCEVLSTPTSEMMIHIEDDFCFFNIPRDVLQFG